MAIPAPIILRGIPNIPSNKETNPSLIPLVIFSAGVPSTL